MKAIVEQVRDGTTLRVRLFLPENIHQFANVALAGVRSAKAATKQGESAEPWGEEASCLPFRVLRSPKHLHRPSFSQNHDFYNDLSASSFYRYLLLQHNLLPHQRMPLHPRLQICSLGRFCILRGMSLTTLLPLGWQTL